MRGVTAKFNTKFPTKEDLETITSLLAEGKLKVAIDTIYPLSTNYYTHLSSLLLVLGLLLSKCL